MTLEEACVWMTWTLTRVLLVFIALRGIYMMARSRRRPDWPTFITVAMIALIGFFGCLGGVIRYLEGID